MKNNNTVLKDELVSILERRLDDKFDILSEKQKDLDDKMSTMTQNHNTLIEMLQRLILSPGQVSGPHMLDDSFHVATQETLVKNLRRIAKRNKD